MRSLDATTGQFGHDAERIVNALQAMAITKGKYESDAKYLSRMKELESEQLYDELTVGSLLAFKPVDVKWTYDANQGKWEYMVREHSVMPPSDAIAISSRKIGNADQWRAIFPGRNLGEYETIAIDTTRAFHIIGGFPSPAEKAALLENKLDVLVIGKLAPPYVRGEQVLPVKHSNDTRVDNVRLVTVRMQEAWVVNRVSGEVLAKSKLRAPR